jgi:hypothetical protein
MMKRWLLQGEPQDRAAEMDPFPLIEQGARAEVRVPQAGGSLATAWPPSGREPNPSEGAPDAGARALSPTARVEVDNLLAGARELLDLGDFSGSLELVHKALALAPGDQDALDYLAQNESTLIQMYESKLGPLTTKFRVVLRPDEVVWLNLDHRAGFILSQIDGTASVDDLYAICGLPRLDTAKILVELLDQGGIAPVA